MRLTVQIINAVQERTGRSPQEKKRLSLGRDRRNVYGENDKSSRRNIPQNKQLGQKMLRRAVSVALSAPIGDDPLAAEDLEASASVAWASKSRRRFRKFPDAPLGEVLKSRRKRNSITAELAARSTVNPPPKVPDRDALVRAAAIEAFCASSSVLRASDVTWGESAVSGTGVGRRFRVDVMLEHLPTETAVTVSSTQAGGHTRKQAQRVRAELYMKALRDLEVQVNSKVRESRRLQRSNRRVSHPD